MGALWQNSRNADRTMIGDNRNCPADLIADALNPAVFPVLALLLHQFPECLSQFFGEAFKEDLVEIHPLILRLCCKGRLVDVSKFSFARAAGR